MVKHPLARVDTLHSHPRRRAGEQDEKVMILEADGVQSEIDRGRTARFEEGFFGRCSSLEKLQGRVSILGMDITGKEYRHTIFA